MTRKQLTLAGALFALGASPALAQSRTTPYPGVNIERFSLDPSARDSLVVDTGKLLPEGGGRLGLAMQFAGAPSVTRVGDEYASLRLDQRILGHVVGAYAPLKWLQLEAQLPIIFSQSESPDLTARGYAPITTNGFAAPILGLRAAVLNQDDGAPVNVTLSANIGLPVGDASALGRDAQMPFRPAVSVGRDFGNSCNLGAQLYGRFRSQENYGFKGISPSENDSVEHELGFALSASGPITDKFRAELGLISDFALDIGGNTTQTFVGARYAATPTVDVFALGGPAFGELVGTPTFRALAGLSIGLGNTAKPAPKQVAVVEAPKDTDGDGIVDAQDQCPGEPEDVDGFQDEDGCPDPDNDGDGLEDAKDACPNDAGEKHRSGCPLPDQDGDGIADDVDQCPAEKGVAAASGCPEKDSDGDGVADRLDLCPQKPGVSSGENLGCPDTDADGLADNLDACVTEKGPKENHGCPDREKQLVVITKEKLQILDKVYFANGKSDVLPKSRILLAQVAKILKEHPEIPKVIIEGHTDDVGQDQKNLKLSQDRADSVRRFLIAEGVEAERLEAKGYGETKPLQPNLNAASREANRRVEFVIVPAPETTPVEPAAPRAQVQ